MTLCGPKLNPAAAGEGAPNAGAGVPKRLPEWAAPNAGAGALPKRLLDGVGVAKPNADGAGAPNRLPDGAGAPNRPPDGAGASPNAWAGAGAPKALPAPNPPGAGEGAPNPPEAGAPNPPEAGADPKAKPLDAPPNIQVRVTGAGDEPNPPNRPLLPAGACLLSQPPEAGAAPNIQRGGLTKGGMGGNGR